MHIDGKPFRTIWVEGCFAPVEIIDQAKLPHRFVITRLRNVDDACAAISTMQVRGAPLIGATAAYGIYLALIEDASDTALQRAIANIRQTRPTAINLNWALDRMYCIVKNTPQSKRVVVSFEEANKICEEDIAVCNAIGSKGASIIQDIHNRNPARPVNILTHCNAGWLATIDWGTATAPIYHARQAGIPVHVWVDETRPRNQGAALTCYELGHENIPHTVIVDNAGGHLMQSGEVDLVITGTDRTLANGDVANKIGTYLKALAAKDNRIPFYVALPSSTIDWKTSGSIGIPIEQRTPHEVTHLSGVNQEGDVTEIRITPAGTAAANPAFDVTPARLITGLITERGVCEATESGLLALFPERAKNHGQDIG